VYDATFLQFAIKKAKGKKIIPRKSFAREAKNKKKVQKSRVGTKK